MRESFKKKIIEVCNKKIETKGNNVGLSFYAFFAKKNDDPELLVEVANMNMTRTIETKILMLKPS